MPKFSVSFYQTEACAVTIEAENADAALAQFRCGDWNDEDADHGNIDIDYEDIEATQQEE